MHFWLQKAGGFSPKKGTHLPGVTFFLWVTVLSEMFCPSKQSTSCIQGTGKAGMRLFNFWNVSDSCASKMEKEKAGCSKHENQTVFLSDVVPSHPYPSKGDKIPSCSFSHSCHLQIGRTEAPNQGSSVVLLHLLKEQVGRLKWDRGAWHALKRQRELCPYMFLWVALKVCASFTVLFEVL